MTATRNIYNENNYLSAVKTDNLQTTIWQPLSQNAKDIYDEYMLGNGYKTTLSFDEYGLPTAIKAKNAANNYLQNLGMQWDETNGNLLQISFWQLVWLN